MDGNLNFNCLLVAMPPEVLDSVVVHELCHRKHLDHSKEFYADVYRVFPDYDRCNKWLKENGRLLISSIRQRILTLPAGTRLLSGHSYETTVKAERCFYL